MNAQAWETEWDLLWIARECALAPLPAGWEEKELENGQVVYFKASTGTVCAAHPLDTLYGTMLLAERRKRSRPAQPWMRFY